MGSEEMKYDPLDFNSPADLGKKLEILGRRLHVKNRIAGGDNLGLWHFAVAITALGDFA